MNSLVICADGKLYCSLNCSMSGALQPLIASTFSNVQIERKSLKMWYGLPVVTTGRRIQDYTPTGTVGNTTETYP